MRGDWVYSMAGFRDMLDEFFKGVGTNVRHAAVVDRPFALVRDADHDFFDVLRLNLIRLEQL